MRTFVALMYVFALLGAVAGALELLSTFASGVTAPQLAALAARAVGFAVVPYVFARAIEGMAKPWPSVASEKVEKTDITAAPQTEEAEAGKAAARVRSHFRG